MSKRIAKSAVTGFGKDLFGAAQTDFRLPAPGSFDFFNSLCLHSSDAFSGVTVARVDSIFWLTDTGRISELKVDGQQPVYAGSLPKGAPMPAGVRDRDITRYIVVISRELRSRPVSYPARLDRLGCIEDPLQDNELRNSVFMFLRAHDLISFDERRKEEARRELISPDDGAYVETSIDEFEKYYEQFEVYAIGKDSVLNDDARSIFWFSYIVAAFGGGATYPYLTDAALEQITILYDEAHWHFTIDNARTAVASSHFKHCFIEFYRCLEWLYSLPRAIAVKRELQLTHPATSLARAFSKELGWRRKERDSLILLLKDAEIHLYSNAQLAKCMLSPVEAEPVAAAGEATGVGTEFNNKHNAWKADLGTKVAARLYQIRNQFVHQFEQDEIEQISREAEPELIHLLCWLCVKLYRTYAPEFA
ncbi:hypothetical protein [Burkholderia pyrrocinia]|uniref:hypothetical protein n=1 Tax=Burkholderia pyrrocinia TaxID=60550 RepID=UPI0010512124|nr:hypothetical protein [Burkholderia pyrrocinia]TDA46210.1 hypothetical protein EVG18_17600 [Burkholderia pyrrocinia]